MPASAQVGDEPVEEVELRPRCRRGPRPARRRPRAGASTRPRAAAAARRATAAASAGRSSGAAPDPVHPGVDLDVDRRRAGPRAARRGAKAVDAVARVQRGREPVGQRGLDGVGAALAQQEHGRRDAVLAQLDPLVDQRHRQPAGAAGQRRPGHRRAAVAVAVGLDDRAELGRARPAAASTAALWVTAARSISAQAGRERPWAIVTSASARPPGPGAHQASGAGVGPSATVRVLPREHGRHQPRQVAGHQALAAARATPPARARGRPAPPPRAPARPGRRKAPITPESTSPLPGRGQRRPAGGRQQDVGHGRRRARPPR